MTAMEKSGFQHSESSESLTGRFAGRDHYPAPTDRDQALAIGFILALIVFIAVL